MPSETAIDSDTDLRRLAALHGLGLLQRGEEPVAAGDATAAADPAFDDIVQLAAAGCDAPAALFTVLGRQWLHFRGRLGLAVAAVPREGSFCAAALAQAPATLLVVPDAQADPRFAGQPLLSEGYRFYAGAVVHGPDGQALGTVCVMDTRPRDLSPLQTRVLQALARQAMALLQQRQQALQLQQTRARHEADMADLQVLQGALMDRERRLDRLGAQVPGVLYQYHLRADGSTGMPYASQGIVELFGLRADQVIRDASPLLTRLHADDVERVTNSIAASARDLTLWDSEYRICVPGRAVRWVHGRSQPERLADGSTLWHGFITDVSERKHAEQQLRERDTVLLQAQRLARMGSWRWRSAERRSEWSDETCRLFGVDPAQNIVADEDFMRFVHPEDANRVMQVHLDALAGRGAYDVQYRAVRKDGAMLVLHARAELTRDPDTGEPQAMVGTLLDVTERVATERELERHRDDLERLVEERTHELIAARDLSERASRAKGEFLSSMSHELRTPMNAILGFSQLLQLDRSLDARSAGFVHEILRAGHHLLDLINDVLDLARIESGKLSLSPEALPLADLVHEAQALVQPLAQQREVQLGPVPPAGLVVRADRLRLKQVLLNLLSNAVKYNRAGGTVRVEAVEHDLFTVRIRVLDTGIGIAAAHLPQLFQPFSRVGGAVAEGTGIGLSISHRLVAMMGGRIGVNSQPGVGSEFWVDLPGDHLADPPPPLQPAGPGAALAPQGPDAGDALAGSPAPPPPARRARVLYVEDNPANLKLLEQIVQRHVRVELLLAPSGGLGLDLARSHRPDLLLLDIHLPDIDGFQVLARLRADPRTQGIPVVAITAQAMTDDVKRVLAAGFDDYIAKPLQVPRVDALLAQLADRLAQAAADVNADDSADDSAGAPAS